MDQLTEERIARNDSVFRDANEGIRRAAADYEVEGGRMPFICECADPHCTKVLVIELADYERVRENARRFVCATGHEETAASALVVERHDGWLVVEKTGTAGEIAEELADE